MTTFSSISKFFLAIAFVTVGMAGVAEAAPSRNAELRKVRRPVAVAVNRPAQAKRIQRPYLSNAIHRPTLVAQNAAPVNARQVKRHERRAQRLARFDLNKDGQIDAGERLAMKKQRFTKLDLNGDHVVTLAEMQSAKKLHMEKRMAKRAERNKQGDARSARRGKFAGKDKGKFLESRFARIDANNNGSITWQEFSAAKGKGPGKRHQRF